MNPTCRSLLASAFALLAVDAASARQVTIPPAQTPAQELQSFEGQYEYHAGGKIILVSDGARLIAIIGDAKYGLRRQAVDLFVNGGGQEIPFQRNAEGRVESFREGGVTFRKISEDVPVLVRSSLHARPPGAPAWRYEQPEDIKDGIATASVEKAGLSLADTQKVIESIVDGGHPDINSILVYRHGHLVLEEYFYGYSRERPHPMRSLTKSVIALGAGAAVDRGMLRSGGSVLAALTEQPMDAAKSKITLAHLLSHRSGLACDDNDETSPGNEIKLYATADWIRSFVALPLVAEPGSRGAYCSAGMLAAGRAVERAAKVSLPEFTQQHIFAPLGISPLDWKWVFALDRSQKDEFAQIYLRPRDMLKLGILVRDRGRWQGRQIVSANWVNSMTAKQARVDGSDYGLGIWHRYFDVKAEGRSMRVDTLMMSGNGGQKVFIVPSLDLIAVFTGSNYNANSPANSIMARQLLPAFLSHN
jgi:CubicO group peptidase (beta-lactamase class C family)